MQSAKVLEISKKCVKSCPIFPFSAFIYNRRVLFPERRKKGTGESKKKGGGEKHENSLAGGEKTVAYPAAGFGDADRVSGSVRMVYGTAGL